MAVRDEEEEVQTELVILGAGQEAPSEAPVVDPEVLSLRKQVEDLSVRADSGDQIRRGIEGLGAVINRAPAPQQISAEPTVETQEEFDRRIEEELFKQGQTGPALRKAIQKIAGETLGAQLNTAIGATVEQTKELLKLDPTTKDVFNRYSVEIENLVRNAPVNIRSQPNVYRLAYNEVLRTHQGELEEERTKVIVQKQFNELLEKNGLQVDDEGNLKKKSEVFLEGGGGVRTSVGATKTKKVYVQPTAEDIRLAREHDYDVAEVVRLRLKRERGEL